MCWWWSVVFLQTMDNSGTAGQCVGGEVCWWWSVLVVKCSIPTDHGQQCVGGEVQCCYEQQATGQTSAWVEDHSKERGVAKEHWWCPALFGLESLCSTRPDRDCFESNLWKTSCRWGRALMCFPEHHDAICNWKWILTEKVFKLRKVFPNLEKSWNFVYAFL